MSHKLNTVFAKAMKCFGLLSLLVGTGYAIAANAEDHAGKRKESGDAVHQITRQPKYVGQPRYALLLLGAKETSKVWMVEDGETLYLDKNGNGDLTDDGPPITPTERRELGISTVGKKSWDFAYQLEGFTRADGTSHGGFRLARWNYGDEKDSYGLCVHVNTNAPMYAGWFGTFWSDKPGTAPTIHLRGPLTPKVLRTKHFTEERPRARFSLAFVNAAGGDGATGRLSIDAVPKEVMPAVRIKWPVAEGQPPLETSHLLEERCCYWEFYSTDLKVPKEAVPGVAKVTVEFPPGSFPFELATDTIEVPVVQKYIAEKKTAER